MCVRNELCPRMSGNTVYGCGRPECCEYVFVGEAPGAKEDELLVPFVGRSGQLLRGLIHDAEISDVSYITNIVKCRPPSNSLPLAEEKKNCYDTYLQQELKIFANNKKLVKIFAVGRTAFQFFFPKEKGRFLDKAGYEYSYNFQNSVLNIVPIPHPSFILRRFSEKNYNAWYKLITTHIKT